MSRTLINLDEELFFKIKDRKNLLGFKTNTKFINFIINEYFNNSILEKDKAIIEINKKVNKNIDNVNELKRYQNKINDIKKEKNDIKNKLKEFIKQNEDLSLEDFNEYIKTFRTNLEVKKLYLGLENENFCYRKEELFGGHKIYLN
jgi:hypothetical protein